jgi:phosphate-selective porin OprO/OprP
MTYTDLDDGPIQGGRFWRFTPMLNWYLSDHLRMEFSYGIGELDRFERLGTTQFFQSRFQFQF